MPDTQDTPARLIAAAERLFAESGEEATSLRAIARAALSNAAAVHYHFGGRDELLRAVLSRELHPLTTRRLQSVERVVADHGEPLPVATVLEAVVRPDLELLAKLRKSRVQVARFLGRAHTLPGTVVPEYLDRQFGLVADRVVPLLHASLPGVAADELRRRLRLVTDMVMVLFATAPDPGRPGPLGSDNVEGQLQRLVAFCGAGMAAVEPVGAPRKRKKR